jgi:hypothetical protein
MNTGDFEHQDVALQDKLRWRTTTSIELTATSLSSLRIHKCIACMLRTAFVGKHVDNVVTHSVALRI